ncbi:hypothetical protein J4E82_004379 [Alternaria postmessia]|uniref:uncharacterized protein n=1 Tax=Alternaria postmessia TaxID=1187938 RepID=UPI0022254724|nr:uncharacterized protein J4E82_004379 [Alternaria postmessia]KAI5377004.1 hypothetical protein J4E82_004379 [Alternaria postmessia]
MVLQRLVVFLVCATLAFSSTQATPLPSPQQTLSARACTNALTNPSFEIPLLTPWMDMVTGSWSSRGISTSPPHVGAHSGFNVYAATSNSSEVTATLTLSQSYIDLPTGVTVDCYAWVRGSRPSGQTRVEIFLDGVSCGQEVQLGVGNKGWKRVGGKVTVQDVVPGVGHSVAVSVQGDGVEDESGWSVAVDDVGVVVGC